MADPDTECICGRIAQIRLSLSLSSFESSRSLCPKFDCHLLMTIHRAEVWRLQVDRLPPWKLGAVLGPSGTGKSALDVFANSLEKQRRLHNTKL